MSASGPEYMRLLASGDLAGAAAVIRDDNPLPATLGRACHHPCELPCLRTHLDDPIAIREIKRFVIDTAAAPPRDLPAPTGNPRAAVIGAGPCGLAAAEFLARAGIAVAVFEARSASGGMVSGSIPGFRAGRDAVDRDLSWIAADRHRGARHGQKVGRDVTLEAMRAAGFRYIVAAAGARRAPASASRATTAAASGTVWASSRRPLRAADRAPRPGRGDRRRRLAIDCGAPPRGGSAPARSTVIYRRSRREMPGAARGGRGARRRGDPGPRANAAAGRGRRLGAVCGLRCRSHHARRARRQRPPAADPDVGIGPRDPAGRAGRGGRQRADLSLFGAERPEVNRAGFLVVDLATLETSLPNVFAGGDLIGDGPATIVKACGDGRRIAAAIAAREGRAATRPPPRRTSSIGRTCCAAAPSASSGSGSHSCRRASVPVSTRSLPPTRREGSG